MKQPIRELEDRIDDFVVGLVKGTFLALRPYTWLVAERVFKLVSWLLAIGALAVIERLPGEFPGWVVPCLLVVWGAALFVAVMEGMEASADRWVGFRDRGIWWYIGVSVSAIGASILVVGVLFPAIVKSVAAILTERS